MDGVQRPGQGGAERAAEAGADDGEDDDRAGDEGELVPARLRPPGVDPVGDGEPGEGPGAEAEERQHEARGPVAPAGASGQDHDEDRQGQHEEAGGAHVAEEVRGEEGDVHAGP